MTGGGQKKNPRTRVGVPEEVRRTEGGVQEELRK
jgi:hypothetical protein